MPAAAVSAVSASFFTTLVSLLGGFFAGAGGGGGAGAGLAGVWARAELETRTRKKRDRRMANLDQPGMESPRQLADLPGAARIGCYCIRESSPPSPGFIIPVSPRAN